jgi:hypothetical protein
VRGVRGCQSLDLCPRHHSTVRAPQACPGQPIRRGGAGRSTPGPLPPRGPACLRQPPNTGQLSDASQPRVAYLQHELKERQTGGLPPPPPPPPPTHLSPTEPCLPAASSGFAAAPVLARLCPRPPPVQRQRPPLHHWPHLLPLAWLRTHQSAAGPATWLLAQRHHRATTWTES